MLRYCRMSTGTSSLYHTVSGNRILHSLRDAQASVLSRFAYSTRYVYEFYFYIHIYIHYFWILKFCRANSFCILTAQPTIHAVGLDDVGDDNVSCNHRAEHRGQRRGWSLDTRPVSPHLFLLVFLFVLSCWATPHCHRVPWLAVYGLGDDLFHNQHPPQLFFITACQPTHFVVHSGCRRPSFSLPISPVDLHPSSFATVIFRVRRLILLSVPE